MGHVVGADGAVDGTDVGAVAANVGTDVGAVGTSVGITDKLAVGVAVVGTIEGATVCLDM